MRNLGAAKQAASRARHRSPFALQAGSAQPADIAGVSYRARQRRAASLQPLHQMGTGIIALGLLELLADHGEPATLAVELPQADPGDRLRQIR